MDWKRVKTILIIALLFINGILAYSLYQDKSLSYEESLDRTLVLDLLEEKGIKTQDNIFEVAMDIPNVYLKLQTYDLARSQEIFLSKSDYGQSAVDLLEIKILDGKALYFNTLHDIYKDANTNDDTIKGLAYELMADLGLSTDDVQLDSIGRTGKKTILTFNQVIDGYVVRDAYMVIKYNNDNLLSFERVWYDVLKKEVIDTDFQTPEYALYDFVGQVYDRFPNRERPIEITELCLVYQLRNFEDSDGLRDLVIEGNPNIFWQIETSDGESYIVDAINE